MPGAGRAAGRAVRETLLTLGAVLGVVCVLLVIAAQLFHVSLILFSTGSMTPTIPAGSVALVRQIPAAEIAVGDIMTIDRPDQLPVTHRVTEVSPGTTDDSRTITMRGDANEVDDAAPYVVTQGRIVMGSVPGLAPVIVWFGSPWVLGGITLAAAALVMWAFWPRAESGAGEVRGARSRGTRVEPASSVARHAALGVIGLFSVGALVGAPVAPAAAAPQPELLVTSDLQGGTTVILPGAQVLWHVTADASTAPADGTMLIAIAAEGDESLGMMVAVRSCAVAWMAGVCPSGEVLLRPAAPAPLTAVEQLLELPTPATNWLQLAITAEPVTDATGDERVALTVSAEADGLTDEVTLGGSDGVGGATGADGALAGTGSTPASVGLLAAPLAVGIGLLLAGLARMRRRRSIQGVAP